MKIPIFGIGITNASTKEILEYLLEIIQNSGKKIYVVTPNPEMIVLSRRHDDFKLALNSADVAICDGVGLYKAAGFVGKPLKERIIGTNFVEKLCEKVEDWPITVGFLGGGPGVAEKVSERLGSRYPKLKIVFIGTEWESGSVALGKKYLESSISYIANKNEKKMPNTKYQIQNTDVIDILFVAFGAPKQELWMVEYLNKIPVRVMIGVGGAFDQLVDPTLRPPQLIHSLGLGWLYRLIRQPWRIKRQAKLLEFVGMVVREKLSS